MPPEPITERWSLQGLGVLRSNSRIRISSSLDFREIFGPGRLPRQWRIMTKPCGTPISRVRVRPKGPAAGCNGRGREAC
jgi:hypothetical protein